ncbi:MAG: diacylglycerol kinase [Deltaproteobacteria bacterium]|nr:diacylglycerol kinase [Deltaproteobacteria bacterium]
MDPPAAPFFVVINEGSGKHGPGSASEVIGGVFTEAAREHHLDVVEDAAALPAAAARAVERARARSGVVVVAGGDGTINAVARATLASGCPLGVVPHGTFNYFGRAHGLPTEPVDAARLLLSARARPVQVGLINDRVFLVNASLGLYPELIEDRETYKQRFGRSRVVAFGAGLATLLREHRQLRLGIADGPSMRYVRTPTLIVDNNRLQLDELGLAEAPAVESGELVAIALAPVGTLALLGLALRGALGRLGEADGVTRFVFQRIVVVPAMPYGSRRVKVATDGEVVWLRAPLEIRVAPEPLMLLAPEPAAEEQPAGEAPAAETPAAEKPSPS